MDQSTDSQHVTEDEVAALARVARLVVPLERLAPLTAELNGALDIIAEMSTVSTGDLGTALAPFDPTWPERHRAEGRR